MLRQQVCVVLNERESTKAVAAETLTQLLRARNITSSRVGVDRALLETIKERNPQVVVIDYLLGDFTTGLDVMESLSGSSIKFIFLTDEPSVPVAVQAMRLGAINYLQLENPQSLLHLVQEIEAVVAKAPRADRGRGSHSIMLADLVADDPKSMEMIKQARSAALRTDPVLVLYGPRGSGRSMLARAIHNERKNSALLKEVDLDLYDGELGELIGHTKYGQELLSLGHNLCLFVDHADEDGGELLDLVSANYRRFWGHGPDEEHAGVKSFLIIGCSDPETKNSWVRLTKAPSIEIPSLPNRPSDFAPLVQKFVSQAGELVKGKTKSLDSGLVMSLSKQSWPGDVRELRGVIIDAVLTNSHSAGDIKDLIESACMRWEAENARETLLIDPLLVASTLEDSSNSMRIAAARLGCTTSQVRQLLKISLLNGGET